MAEFHGIPIPSADQIIIGTELVAILYVPKKLMNKLDTELRTIRNHIIRRHVKAGHEGRLKHCDDESCASLRNQHPQLPVGQNLSEVLDIEV